MTKVILVLFLICSSALAEPPKENQAQSCQHDKTTFRCVKYIKNYDGDTVTVKLPDVHPLFGDNISVRIDGIDTAEVKTKDQCEKTNARTARKLVQSVLSKAKSIELRNVKRGKYFRIVADVVADGKSVKDILVLNNLAVAYDGGTKTKVNWCNMGKRIPATANDK